MDESETESSRSTSITCTALEILPSCVQGVKACMCPRHKPKVLLPLTELILDCWQREYDKRPYENLIIHVNLFRQRMYREPKEYDFRVILAFLSSRKNVKNFELAYVDLPGKPAFIENFAKVLINLDKLSLISANVPAKMLKVFAENAEAANFRMLRLSGNELTMEHAKHLRCFLMHSKKLVYLDVGSCSLDEYTFSMVADGVDKSKSLKAVDMSRVVNRTLVSCVDENKLAIVAAILIWRSPLVEIHLKHCGLDSGALTPMLEYITGNQTLRFLDLGSNKIEGSGMKQLLHAIIKSEIIGLDISNNRLGEYGGMVIAHHVPATKLRYLDIGRNQIPAQQMHFIFSTIKKSSRMRILNVTGNEFNQDAGATLSRQMITKLFLLEETDVSVTYDQAKKEFRVVPCENKMAKYNERYYRVANSYKMPKPFFVTIDDAQDLNWESKWSRPKKKMLVNGLFVGPFVVSNKGETVGVDDGRWEIKQIC